MGITFDRADGARWYDFDFDVTPGEQALVGLVLSKHVEHDVRIMSDVWTDAYTARVWDAAAGVPRTVVLGYSEMGGALPCEVDATPAVRAAYDVWAQADAARAKAARAALEAQRAAERAQQAEDDARDSVLRRIEKGDRVVVARGRKVAHGTEGVVSWVGQDNYGKSRIGVRDDAGETHWTAMDNVDRYNMAELVCLAAAHGGWVALADAHREEALRVEQAAAAEATARIERTGVLRNSAVVTPCGKRGTVFWLSGDGRRCGVRVGKDRNDVVWADTDKVAVVTAGGRAAA